MTLPWGSVSNKAPMSPRFSQLKPVLPFLKVPRSTQLERTETAGYPVYPLGAFFRPLSFT